MQSVVAKYFLSASQCLLLSAFTQYAFAFDLANHKQFIMVSWSILHQPDQKAMIPNRKRRA
ncbi:hypothetical protein C2E15_03550 [Mixta gaviniae]|uniref:Uncharacterized protein n=1 Tax=Mixta gaviniae TaxID=665914 RepID=A0A2L0ICC6_9GAMM|nr:hypothetical protein C2E15_03550 [Mixta gaviniae]